MNLKVSKRSTTFLKISCFQNIHYTYFPDCKHLLLMCTGFVNDILKTKLSETKKIRNELTRDWWQARFPH